MCLMCIMCFICFKCFMCLICLWTHRWPAGPCFLTLASFPIANYNNITLFRTFRGLEVIQISVVLLSIPFYCGGKIVSYCHSSQSGTTPVAKKMKIAQALLFLIVSAGSNAVRVCLCRRDFLLDLCKFHTLSTDTVLLATFLPFPFFSPFLTRSASIQPWIPPTLRLLLLLLLLSEGLSPTHLLPFLSLTSPFLTKYRCPLNIKCANGFSNHPPL